MKTQWTDTVDRDHPLNEYPRPQMVRAEWMNLNGRWEYSMCNSPVIPKSFDGEIIVPFSPETELSGVGRSLKSDEYLWYRKRFTFPESFRGKRVLLHFGAVDQTAKVFVNGRECAYHVGGYTPFSVDITEYMDGLCAEIIVRVTDNTDCGSHSRGKQSSRRGGIWYTPQSGIWQTVWAEAVSLPYVKSLRITP